MKRILFLGDFFPNFSMNSLRNHAVTKQLVANGFSIYLVSDAWLNTDKNSHIYSYLEEMSHITKYYYVDPIQAQYSTPVIALVSLASSIIRKYDIDYIYVSDVQQYGPVAEILNLRLGIGIVNALYSDYSVLTTYEMYTKEWFEAYVSKTKFLATHGHKLDLLSKYGNNVIADIYPYQNLSNEHHKLSNKLIIFGCVNSRTNIDYFVNRISKFAQEYDVKLLIKYNHEDKIEELLSTNEKICRIDISAGLDSLLALSGSIAVTTEYIFSENDALVDQSLLLLNYGFFPAIRKNSCTMLRENFSANIINYNEQFSLLSSVSPREVKTFAECLI